MTNAPTPAATPAPALAQPSSTATGGQPLGQSIAAFFAAVQREQSGLAAAAVVFVAVGIISWAGWIPLSWPPRLVNSLVPDSNCVGEVPGSGGMYVCSARVALQTLVGPIIVAVGIFLLRKQLTALAARLAPKMPEGSQFLVAPLLATTLFVIPWAGIHYETADQSGLVPQRIFPAIVGLYTFSITRFGPAFQARLRGFFDVRDRYPMALRLIAAFLIPAAIALLITNQDRVSETALKEQFVVLISLVTGYLALSPRSGDFAASVRQMLPRQMRPG